jgi:hypothetical protein
MLLKIPGFGKILGNNGRVLKERAQRLAGFKGGYGRGWG